jgi:hypothetical protein
MEKSHFRWTSFEGAGHSSLALAVIAPNVPATIQEMIHFVQQLFFILATSTSGLSNLLLFHAIMPVSLFPSPVNRNLV